MFYDSFAAYTVRYKMFSLFKSAMIFLWKQSVQAIQVMAQQSNASDGLYYAALLNVIKKSCM